MKKLLLSSITIGSILLMPVSHVFAGESRESESASIFSIQAIPEIRIETAVTREAAPASIDAETRKSALVAAGLRLTNQRILALNKAKTKIAAQKNLSVSQKAALTAELETSVAAMQKITTAIKADTMDAVALKAQIKAIYSDYRIFAVVLPRVNYETAFDVQTTHSANLATSFAKFQTRIDAAKLAGIDVVAVQSALDVIKAKNVVLAQTITTNRAAVAAIGAADYPTKSKQAFVDARAQVKANTQSFKNINNQISAGIKMIVAAANTAQKAVVKTAEETYKSEAATARTLTDKAAQKTAMRAAQEKMKQVKNEAHEAHKAVAQKFKHNK